MPISTLPNISKVYKRYLYGRYLHIFDNIFSKYWCGFRKDYSGSQHCLLIKTEKWKKNCR